MLDGAETRHTMHRSSKGFKERKMIKLLGSWREYTNLPSTKDYTFVNTAGDTGTRIVAVKRTDMRNKSNKNYKELMDAWDKLDGN